MSDAQNTEENKEVKPEELDAQMEKEFDDAFNEATGNQSHEEASSSDGVDQEEGSEKVSHEGKGGESEHDNPEEKEGGGDKSSSSEEEQYTPEQIKKMRQDLEYYKQGFDSNRGRVSALQKKLDAIERNQPQQQVHQQQTPEGVTDEQWAQFKEEYPEMAAAMEARMGATEAKINQLVEQKVNARLEGMQAEISPLIEKSHRDEMTQKEGLLEDRHPGWTEVVRSDDFKQWIGAQPAAVQGMIDSDDVQDASWLLDQFKSANGGANSGGEGNPSDERDRRNQERLATNMGLKGQGKRRQTGVPNDFDSAWEAITQS